MSRLVAVQLAGCALIALSVAGLALKLRDADGRAAALRDRIALEQSAHAEEVARLQAESQELRDLRARDGRKLEQARIEIEDLIAAASRREEQLRADLDAARARLELEQVNAKQAALRVGALEERAAGAEKMRDTLQTELLAANDRLEKAYKDIAEMEKQMVDVSRMHNDLTQQLAELRRRFPKLPQPRAVIQGVVLGVSDKVNLVLISVGRKNDVEIGTEFDVIRGDKYISKLVVDKVQDGWAACKELTEFRKDAIQQGDKVTTHAFD